MILCDVNVLIYAHRAEFSHSEKHRSWLEEVLKSDEPYGVSDFVLSSFLRIVTHHGVFDPPSTMRDALAFATVLRGQPNGVAVEPGDRHWEIFTDLCLQPDVKGRLVTDAYLAAIAIEHGCELVTHDGDFKRFAPRLKVRAPFLT